MKNTFNIKTPYVKASIHIDQFSKGLFRGSLTVNSLLPNIVFKKPTIERGNKSSIGLELTLCRTLILRLAKMESYANIEQAKSIRQSIQDVGKRMIQIQSIDNIVLDINRPQSYQNYITV